MRNKIGQVGETMTWTVATIIIIVMTVLFIYAAGLLSSQRGATNVNIGLSESFEGDDFINQQMLFSILESKHNGRSILELAREGNLNAGENGNVVIGLQMAVKKILDSTPEKGFGCIFIIQESKDGKSFKEKIRVESSGTYKKMGYSSSVLLSGTTQRRAYLIC